MDATDNVFQLFGEQRAVPQPAKESGKASYYACGVSENSNASEEWFRVHLADGAIEMCRYGDILSIYCPVHQLLIIICETCVFELEGQHLDIVLLLIQDRNLRALYLFDEEHNAEPDESEPIIRQIERRALRAE